MENSSDTRISKSASVLMMTVAVIFDLLSAIPWVGLIFSGAGYFVLWLWFTIEGVSSLGFSRKAGKKMAAFGSEWVAGIFGLSIWPGITAWTWIVIRDSRAEDKENGESTAKMEGQGKRSGIQHKDVTPNPNRTSRRSAYM